MAQERIESDILGQPASLASVAAHQFGAGLAALQEAARAIAAAPSVILSGMGSSAYACVPLACQIGAQIIESGELLHFPRPVHTVVLVSRSGETVEVVRAIPELKARKARIIGITNEPSSTLAAQADITLLTNSFDDEMVAIQSYTGTLLTILILGAILSGEPLEPCRARVDALINTIRTQIPVYIEQSLAWRDFFVSAQTIYLLGRGPSFASALEGSLMFNEAAKTPAVAMTGGNFRHGPVEVVDPAFRAIVFASQPATRTLDLGLAADIARFGGGVKLIHAPDVHPPLATVLEIVPVQIASWRLTQWKEIPRGVFRFATRVTTREERF
jgi:glucosamine--fructose-6-phosphate aminotransferase (isomerizing)